MVVEFPCSWKGPFMPDTDEAEKLFKTSADRGKMFITTIHGPRGAGGIPPLENFIDPLQKNYPLPDFSKLY